MQRISTGKIIREAAKASGDPLLRRWDTGMELFVLFDEHSTTPFSPVFVVRPGEAVILTAYGLRSRNYELDPSTDTGRIHRVDVPPEMVIVERLRFDLSTLPHGDACCGGTFESGPLTHAAPVAQCGLWMLSPKQNVGILSLPGTYRLRACPEDAVGCFYVDGARLESGKVAHVPKDLWFGEVTAPNATVIKDYIR